MGGVAHRSPQWEKDWEYGAPLEDVTLPPLSGQTSGPQSSGLPQMVDTFRPESPSKLREEGADFTMLTGRMCTHGFCVCVCMYTGLHVWENKAKHHLQGSSSRLPPFRAPSAIPASHLWMSPRTPREEPIRVLDDGFDDSHNLQ